MAEIHRIGCRSGDTRVATLVAGAPLRIAYAAIRARDHLLFREFTIFAFRLYEAALAEKDSKMREYLVDRAWRHLSELGNFGVQLELRRTTVEAESIRTLTDFGTTLLLRFQDLLRTSLDSRQLADFQLFKNAASKLFEHLLDPRPARANTASLKVRLLQPGLTNEEQKNLSDHLDRQELLEKSYEDFQARRSQMFFGLGSHIFKKHIAEPKNEVVSDFLSEIDGLVPKNQEALTELYMSFSDHKLQSVWGWEWWDTPQEGPWMGNPFEKITQYYCFQLAKACQALSRDQVLGLSFPRSGLFVNGVSANGPVATTLESFSSDRDKWRDIIPDTWIANVEALGAAFERLVRENAREQEDRLIAAELDRNLLENFRSRFKSAFLANAGIRRVFTDCKAYRDESAVPPKNKGGLKWGLNVVEDKRFYVEKGLDPDFGKRHGEQLGSSECQSAFEEVIKLLPESEVRQEEKIEDIIYRGITELRDSGHDSSAILMDLGFNRQTDLEQSSSFTAAWRLEAQFRENPAFIGIFLFEDRKIPVYTVWGTSQKNRVCVMALPACMQWVQKSPIDDDSEIALAHELFSIRIADLAKEDELRTQILSQPPQWLSEQKDPDRYLRTHVWLQIFERFEFTLKQPDAGRKFTIPG